MDENIFAGERLDSAHRLSRNNLLEHLARYRLVRGRKKNCVLDIGCGPGHGSHELSKSFAKVYGVDISKDAISYAKKHWPGMNISYQVGSGTKLQFKDNTFDVAVAFEVFEHIKNWKSFLAELRRVTKANGYIYISTPNKKMYSPGTKKPINPHHAFEMTPDEFCAALKKFFTIQTLYGQRTPIYNDHWIWRIVDPVLFLFGRSIPYKVNNTIKLKLINWIKPELELSDIVFVKGAAVHASRFMIAVCKNTRK